jgi:hypothetical protein
MCRDWRNHEYAKGPPSNRNANVNGAKTPKEIITSRDFHLLQQSANWQTLDKAIEIDPSARLTGTVIVYVPGVLTAAAEMRK